MARLLTLVFSLFCLCCVGHRSGPPVTPPSLGPWLGAPSLDMYAVALTDEDGEIFCSGTWIGPETVLTAGHCLKGQVIVYVRSNPGESPMIAFPVRVSTTDLGLLSVPGARLTTHGQAPVGPEPKVGDQLESLNNTWRMENSYMRGYVGGYQVNTDQETGQLFMQAMLPASSGASGSAAFDSEGRIVGVCSWKFRNLDGEIFYVRASDIVAFLAIG